MDSTEDITSVTYSRKRKDNDRAYGRELRDHSKHNYGSHVNDVSNSVLLEVADGHNLFNDMMHYIAKCTNRTPEEVHYDFRNFKFPTNTLD